METWCFSLGWGKGFFLKPEIHPVSLQPALPSHQNCPWLCFFWGQIFQDVLCHEEGGKVQDQSPALLHLMQIKPAKSNTFGYIYGSFAPSELPGSNKESSPLAISSRASCPRCVLLDTATW